MPSHYFNQLLVKQYLHIPQLSCKDKLMQHSTFHAPHITAEELYSV